MKRLTLLCISPLVLANVAFAGGMNTPAYKHEARPHHHHTAPRYFNGFSITGAVGGIAAEVDAAQNVLGRSETEVMSIEGTDIFSSLTSSDNLELTETNVAGLVGIEYAFQFHNGFLMGIAATAGFNYVDVDNTVTTSDFTYLNDEDTNYINYNNADVTLKAKLDNDFAILFKPGFVVRENTLIYALVGPRWGNFHTTLSSSYNNNGGIDCDSPDDCDSGWNGTLTDSASNSKYQVGITAGVGIRQVIADHVMLGLEYAYTHYGDLDELLNTAGPEFFTNPAHGGEAITSRVAFSAAAQDLASRTNTVMATLSYKF
jgi:opacity protein-like surface antigen